MKKLMFLLALLAVVLVACNDDDSDQPQTIADFVEANANYSSLSAALDRASLKQTLDGSTKFTVFAPDNAAFSAFLSSLGFSGLNDVPVDVLTQVLLTHVISGEVMSSDLQTGYAKVLATESTTGNNVDLYLDTSSGVEINGSATVMTADINVANGIIHAVNSVIAPPTIVTHALSNPAFSTLVAALTRPSFGSTFTDLLSGSGPFTVFAPTNDAFADLLVELNANSLDDIDDATLTAVLQYHVVSGANVLSSALTDGQTVTTAQGGTFEIDLSSGPQIIDAKSRVSDIIITDVQAANGVVHAINKVILP